MILPTTASLTEGLCMPCKKGKKPAPPRKEVWFSVHVDDVLFRIEGTDLLPAMERVKPIAGNGHPNELEIAALLGLVRHYISIGRDCTLQNDHWNRTCYVCCDLFEKGKASLLVARTFYTFDQISKIDWKEGTDALAMYGGFAYLDKEGNELYRRCTWRS
ncbi:hypothetical protein [Roseimicrobium sp. ORNL1]|uniref:hypothetical protein n=1 Tax=Roseimicrobium sp. ORNL1 TaxID=2711231 RepID=UPI0013E1FC04|nr:hypothetical protein [Roseimicrobium sp. ORNL1]QIF01780.1 hypothetical protein G5S37_09660 [Roseimicrobium sp. ORNL1]